MIRKIKDGVGALEESLESLLIRYRYDASSGTLELVLDYHDKAAGADRAFLRLQFMGVSYFNRIPGGTADLQRFKESFSTRETIAAIVVQSVDIKKKVDSLHIVLSFGSFGKLSFVCQSISAESRSTRVVGGKGTWAYYDFDDGKSVDFYDPFE